MKRAFILALALVLAVSAMITGTVAYLTSVDQDVNIMTLGGVEIKQHEMQRRDGVEHTGVLGKGDLEAFEQNQPLYPAVPLAPGAYTAEQTELLYWGPYVSADGAGNGLWDDEKLYGAIDKMVFVENTGKSECYYRTWLAFECPEGMAYSQGSDQEFMMNVNGYEGFSWKRAGFADIKNNDTGENVHYLVMCATYNAPLAAGEISRPSLLQVVMTGNATNEDMEKLGDSYEILAFTQAVQTENFKEAYAHARIDEKEWAGKALDAAFGPQHPWSGGYAGKDSDTWDGTADISWYNENAAEFRIDTAEKLAGLSVLVDGGATFAGKTVKLEKDVNLYVEDANGDPICFEPIGSYRNTREFKGTFDGQGHTISNMSQNSRALNNGYYYDDMGMGLFCTVRDAHIKNLVLDNASISGDSAMCGAIAGAAFGDCSFEKITVSNSEVADHQYYAGGIVGWASGNHKYIECNVDASTTIAAQWGDHNNATGGIIGGCGENAAILLEKCNVACRIDAYNDVVYIPRQNTYRRSGMLLGYTSKTQLIGEATYAAAPQITAKDCTVTYGDWANYTYCEFTDMNYPYVRVQAGVSNPAYSHYYYGVPTDANGDPVQDDSHAHKAGEDHFIAFTFDQLYGGGQGVYGQPAHEGVTVIYKNR